MAGKTAIRKIKLEIAILSAIAEYLPHIYVQIIAGGKGTRLHPMSNKDLQKQHCVLGNTGMTFLQSTVARFIELGIDPSHILTETTTNRQTELSHEQYDAFAEMTDGELVMPYRTIFQANTNSYPCAMIYMSRIIYDMDPEAIIISVPADQFAKTGANWRKAMVSLILSALIRPTIVAIKTNSIYQVMSMGNVKYKLRLDDDSIVLPENCYEVDTFVEKPQDRKVAKDLLECGCSAINTGINAWTAKHIVECFKDFDLDAMPEKFGTDDFMERLGKKNVVIGDFRWLDCGSWKDYREVCEKTQNDRNALISLNSAQIQTYGCIDSLFYANAGHLLYADSANQDAICVEQIRDTTVIQICGLEESQQVRRFAAAVGKYDVYDTIAEDIAVYEQRLQEAIKQSEEAEAKFKTENPEPPAPSNNIVTLVGVTSKVAIGFIGVRNYAVTVVEKTPGRLEVYATKRRVPPIELADESDTEETEDEAGQVEILEDCGISK